MEVQIAAEREGRTVRSVLRGDLHFSARALSRLKCSPTGILVNGAHANTTHVLQIGDVLTVESGDQRGPKCPVIPGNWPMDIVWEDAHLLVANKPDGMTAHASSFLPETPTVAGALAWSRGTDFLFHAVNRLDKGTTGLMVVAKSGYVHDLLRKLLHSEQFSREYLGICVGLPHPAAGLIDLPIGRDLTSTVKRAITPDGAAAVTRYEVVSRHESLTLLKLRPQTGRTHQLRLHMASIGHPLAGDWLYGTADESLISRPALHSHALSFTHPVTGEMLHLTAPLPADMERLLTQKF